MKKAFWCVHHIIIDSDGYYESIKACSSKEIAEKIDGINVISLSNEKNKLLNESEYLLNQDLINRVIIDI